MPSDEEEQPRYHREQQQTLLQPQRTRDQEEGSHQQRKNGESKCTSTSQSRQCMLLLFMVGVIIIVQYYLLMSWHHPSSTPLEISWLLASSNSPRLSTSSIHTIDNFLPHYRRPLRYDWASFESPLHNFGRPTIRLVCSDTPPLPFMQEEHEYQQMQLSPHIRNAMDCHRVREAELTNAGGALSDSRTLMPVPSSFFFQRPWPNSVYQFAAHPELKKRGAHLVSYMPGEIVKLHPASQGPKSMNSIANELHRVGFPAYMYYLADSERDPQLPNVDLGEQANYLNDSRLGSGFILILPESNSLINDALIEKANLQDLRILKVHLGWHRLISQQSHPKAGNLCIVHHFASAFKCARGQFMPKLSREIMIEVNRYHALPDSKRPQKERLVLIDDDAPSTINVTAMEIYLHRYHNITLIQMRGYTRNETVHMLQRASATLDFGLPGREAMNSEGSLFNCITLVGLSGAGLSTEDFPFPSRYHIDPRNQTQAISVIIDAVNHYSSRIHDFAMYRELSRNVVDLFQRDIGMIFHARNVLFYLFAPTMQSVVEALACVVSIQHVYPLALIEILTPISWRNVDQTYPMLWQNIEAYLPYLRWNNPDASSPLSRPAFRAFATDADPAPELLFVTPPVTKYSAFTVFVPNPTTIFLGPDFVNEYVAHLLSDDSSPLIALPTHVIGDPLRVDLTVPILAESVAYWKQVQSWMEEAQEKADLMNTTFVVPSLESLFQLWSIPLMSPITLIGAVPLPLDFIIVNIDRESNSAVMSFYMTRNLRIILAQPMPFDESIARNPSLGTIGRSVDLANSRLWLLKGDRIPQAVRDLIDLLLNDPLWQQASPYFPNIWRMLRYFV